MPSNFSSRLTPHSAAQACILALALVSSPFVRASDIASGTSPMGTAEAKKVKRAAIHALAEKNREARKAHELTKDDLARQSEREPAEAEVSAPEYSRTAKFRGGHSEAERTEQPERAAFLREKTHGEGGVASAVQDVIDAVMPAASARSMHPPLSANDSRGGGSVAVALKDSGRTAGFMAGLKGPWPYAHTKTADLGETAETDASILERRYQKAEHLGWAARYLALVLVAGGLCYAVKKLIFGPSTGRSRRTPVRSPNPLNMPTQPYNSRSSLFERLRRKPTTVESVQGPSHAILVGFDMDTLRDYAFNLLFARGRHDLSGVGDMLTPSFARCLMSHFVTLEAKSHWNKVVRVEGVTCAEMESWQEGDTSYAKLNVTWRALDYVVNFNRSIGDAGYLIEGDPNLVENFSEEWIVQRRAGDAWQVDAMYPAASKLRQ